MSVLIKNMEMPKNCYVCEFITFDSGWICKRLKRKIINVEKCNPKDKDCPLVEVFAPHGDLIDRNALIEFCAERWIPLNIDAVNMQQTVIKEEE